MSEVQLKETPFACFMEGRRCESLIPVARIEDYGPKFQFQSPDPTALNFLRCLEKNRKLLEFAELMESQFPDEKRSVSHTTVIADKNTRWFVNRYVEGSVITFNFGRLH